MAKNMRVHELAKELGMTNGEAVDLALTLGVPVKSHSSSLNEAYADMVRRRAVRDGLTRPEQPEEAKPAKKAAAQEGGGHIVDRRGHAGRRVGTDRGGRPRAGVDRDGAARAHDRRAAGRRAGRGRSRRRPSRGGHRARAAGSHRLVGHHLLPPRPPPPRPRRWPTCPRRPRSPSRSSRRPPPPRPSRRPPPRPCREPAVQRAGRARAGRRHGLQRRSRRVRRDREGHLVGRPTSRTGRRRPRGPHAGSGGRPHRSRSAPGNGRRPGRRPRRCTAAARPSDVADGQADPAAPGSSAVAVGSSDPAASRQRPALTAAHDRSRPAHHRSGRSAPRRSRRPAPGRSRPSRRLHARWRPPRRSAPRRSRRWSGSAERWWPASERTAPPTAAWPQPTSSSRPRGAAAAVHELHAQRRAGARRRRRDRARRVGPGVRSQAQPHRGRRRALPAQQRRDGHGHDDALRRADGAVRPRDRRRDPARRAGPAGGDPAPGAVRRQRRRGEPAGRARR